ncbi:alpha/beta fold hydrolase [Sinosporangium siamense]|uniref:AB hydrolase-1 domain-containing protein n=1 Tax=Sinosporangium siamense TaxID=1367973 RepID=A0A919RC23_9ACTN|nr:alpha/beta fold hydrolase [Sinosporangium siamense]GII91165.1 hypothetical protein Ssi02_13960 [Sinosporangium siamense]
MSRPTIRTDHVTEIVPFTALDGHPLTLVHVTGREAPVRGPVMLVHGAGVRAEIFRPPTSRTLVDVLLDEGFDVWMLNWRASIDLEPVPWTLDEVAAYDHPAAVHKVLKATGAQSLKAVVHCQGSTSFTISALAGLLPEVDTIVSNAVSLHTVIPSWSRFKIQTVAPLIARLTPYISPAWGDRSEGWLPWVMKTFVRLTHRECDNLVCRMVSFTYGSGFPALWSHRNLDAATHDWVRGEFAEVPMTFFAQMADCVTSGHLVPVSRLPGLPESYVAQAPKTDARFAFLAGEENLCFLPESQRRSFEFFNRHRAGKDTLHTVPGYGHLDMLLGKNAARDVFPLIVSELTG